MAMYDEASLVSVWLTICTTICTAATTCLPHPSDDLVA
jgi:hypothetical protein